jgi:hypothetical protein
VLNANRQFKAFEVWWVDEIFHKWGQMRTSLSEKLDHSRQGKGVPQTHTYTPTNTHARVHEHVHHTHTFRVHCGTPCSPIDHNGLPASRDQPQSLEDRNDVRRRVYVCGLCGVSSVHIVWCLCWGCMHVKISTHTVPKTLGYHGPK